MAEGAAMNEQDLICQIAVLEARIDALEAENARLRAAPRQYAAGAAAAIANVAIDRPVAVFHDYFTKYSSDDSINKYAIDDSFNKYAIDDSSIDMPRKS